MDSNVMPVSERGVVFLRNQDVTTKDLLTLGEKLSTLTGSVSASHSPLVRLPIDKHVFSPSLLLFISIPLLKPTASLVIKSASFPVSSKRKVLLLPLTL